MSDDFILGFTAFTAVSDMVVLEHFSQNSINPSDGHNSFLQCKKCLGRAGYVYLWRLKQFCMFDGTRD